MKQPVKIIVEDRTDYINGLHNNGGHYIDYTIFKRCKGGKYRVSYDTSADFSFCPCCGGFGELNEKGHCDFCDGNYEMMNIKEIIEKIKYYKETKKEDLTINFYY